MLAFHARSAALSPALQAGAFSPAIAGAAFPTSEEEDPALVATPPAFALAIAEGVERSPNAVQEEPSGFRSIIARELWDRKRRKEHISRHVVDAGVIVGAACVIATMGCDLPTALTRTLVILGGVKAVLYPFVVACEVHDFRAGEQCLSRRVYDWFHRPTRGIPS